MHKKGKFKMTLYNLTEQMITALPLEQNSTSLGQLTEEEQEQFCKLWELQATKQLLGEDDPKKTTLHVDMLRVNSELQRLLEKRIPGYTPGKILVTSKTWEAVRVNEPVEQPLLSSLESEMLAAEQ